MALTDNIIAYWKLDGNSTDATGNGRNGTDTSITYNAGNGKLVQGAGLNGTSSRISITDNAALKPTAAFTIATWIKQSSSTNFVDAFSSWNDNPSAGGFALIGNNGSHKARMTVAHGGTTATITGGTTVDDGVFHHVVGTYDGTNMRLYVDGLSDATAVASGNPAYNATNLVYIGAEQAAGSPTNFFNGAIDEGGFWSRALSLTEIQNLWAMGGARQYPFAQNGMVSFMN